MRKAADDRRIYNEMKWNEREKDTGQQVINWNLFKTDQGVTLLEKIPEIWNQFFLEWKEPSG